MKNFGIVSYNIHANFTNYGSALQSWALSQAINKVGKGKWQAKLVDYCPDILKDKDPLNPMKNMWDKDEEYRRECEKSLPAIRVNYEKFNKFYNEEFIKTKNVYTSENFNDIISEENIDGFVCGSDTIFCIDEFGFDDGYYSNYDCMKNGYSISYAASFGDAHFDNDTYKILNNRLRNFNAIGIREDAFVPYVKEHTDVEVQRCIDPTLLLDKEEYTKIEQPVDEEEKYLLLYARRKNTKMSKYAEKIAQQNGWKVIEISLQASNADKHKMFYEAGVGEFLSLVKNAEFVVTNSYHGMIFSVIYEKQFVIFSREQCNTKIAELLKLFDLSDRMLLEGNESYEPNIDFKGVKKRIENIKNKSIDFLTRKLDECK